MKRRISPLTAMTAIYQACLARRSMRYPLVLLTALLLASPAVHAETADAGASLMKTTNRIIVKFNDEPVDAGIFDRRSILLGDKDALALGVGAQFGGNLLYSRTLGTGAELFRMETERDLQALRRIAARLARDPNVDYAEPDQRMQPLAIPNDPLYADQWHYFESTGGLSLPDAWDTTTGTGVVVAVIDTGYRPHADLVANILPGFDMISDPFTANDGDGRDNDAIDPGDPCGSNFSSWHGTHVAGTVAAVANNGLGVAGVAYGASVVPVRVLGRCGGYTSDIADGVIWAAGGTVGGVPANANPAQVLNLSLGGFGSCSNTYQDAFDIARANGATTTVSAGNSSSDAANFQPASCNGVITVAATNRNGGRANYSNFGAVVEIAAPGGQILPVAANGVLSTLNAGAIAPGPDIYEYYQGTSMAAPHVAGLAALLYSVNPELTPDQVEAVIIDTARAFPGTCDQCGSGIADAAAAVASLSGSPDDVDGDFVLNNQDNCVTISNTSQYDSNGDGYGNACDADLDNNGIVNFLDLDLLGDQFLTAGPDGDLNGDGSVNFLDLSIAGELFFMSPGPSALVPPGAVSIFDISGTVYPPIHVQWLDASGYVEEYEIERKHESNGSWVPIGTTAATVWEFSTHPCGEYSYRVRAVNTNGGPGPWDTLYDVQVCD